MDGVQVWMRAYIKVADFDMHQLKFDSYFTQLQASDIVEELREVKQIVVATTYCYLNFTNTTTI